MVPWAQTEGPVVQSAPAGTVVGGARQVPAQHGLPLQLSDFSQPPAPTHSSLKKQVPPAATVPVKILLQAAALGLSALNASRVHEERMLTPSTQARAETPS